MNQRKIAQETLKRCLKGNWILLFAVVCMYLYFGIFIPSVVNDLPAKLFLIFVGIFLSLFIVIMLLKHGYDENSE